MSMLYKQLNQCSEAAATLVLPARNAKQFLKSTLAGGKWTFIFLICRLVVFVDVSSETLRIKLLAVFSPLCALGVGMNA